MDINLARDGIYGYVPSSFVNTMQNFLPGQI